MAKKLTDDVTPAPALSDARIKVLERRLQNPLGESSAPIDLKDRSLVCRWFNAAISSDKVWRAKNKGWEPVRPEDLVDPDQVGGFTKSPEGYVTRGDRGQEILMQMPRTYREQIEVAKARANMKNMGDPVATKNEIVSAASDQLGDQGADFLNRNVGIVGGVRDQYERIQRQDGIE
jgi:hypothetical protein